MSIMFLVRHKTLDKVCIKLHHLTCFNVAFTIRSGHTKIKNHNEYAQHVEQMKSVHKS